MPRWLVWSNWSTLKCIKITCIYLFFYLLNYQIQKRNSAPTCDWETNIFLSCCYGFALQGFGSGGAIGVASVRRCEKLPPCLIEPVPASSKMDPPLAKAKPMVVASLSYLRREEKIKPVGKRQSRERSETMWENQLCGHQGQSRKRGEEVLEMPEQRVFPCSSWWKTMVRQVVPLQPVEVYSGADLHL